MSGGVPDAPTYADCGACGAPEAPVKCSCKACHYCNAACQRADFQKHKLNCTCWLIKDIDKKRTELLNYEMINRLLQAPSGTYETIDNNRNEILMAQSSSYVFDLEQRMAEQHKHVGCLLSATLHAVNVSAAEKVTRVTCASAQACV